MTTLAPTPAKKRWLDATWSFVSGHLPPAPARVLEIGCGPFGGLVPMLRERGYDAVGVDPEAPDGPGYERVEFERYAVPGRVDAVVACTSLHHVADLGDVLDRVTEALVPGGTLVVVEWAREGFDEATAEWCFARLAEAEEPGWLHRHRDRWAGSGLPWASYIEEWVSEHHPLHTGRDLLEALGDRFEARLCERGPYFFSELDGVTEADEQAAADRGDIRPNGIRWVGATRPASGRSR
ncbi:bifunctional 2-polyprenyl-6-hydroxyphenol methylase/3-demethylubiquinol 3-O-methyltransferase UbiG [Microbispora sp. KK1-11]|uniref:class I SAM-dependent methyltransferase n=1 Tax=Microbispora sp. KK1-11 TaxID=2053005 RepID=UPI00115794EA|nr:methyltransferase domain-containing protein [Microbispora sp. KK1-11]TQS25425.1 class I SAM-dependent methyltransferase [Microbispora sp. KK1-11]